MIRENGEKEDDVALAEDAANTATVLGFREGAIVSATAGASTGTDAVYAFLAWEKGSFRFAPGDPGARTISSSGRSA